VQTDAHRTAMRHGMRLMCECEWQMARQAFTIAADRAWIGSDVIAARMMWQQADDCCGDN